jgi:hypothetical protein
MNDECRREIIVRCYIALFDDFFDFSTKDTFVRLFSDHIARSIDQFADSTDLSNYSAHCFDSVDSRDMTFVSVILLLRHDDTKMIYYEDDKLTCAIMKEIDTREIDTREIDTREIDMYERD